MSPNDKSEARCAPEKAPACACGHLRVDHRPVRDEQHCLHCRCNDFAPATEGAAVDLDDKVLVGMTIAAMRTKVGELNALTDQQADVLRIEKARADKAEQEVAEVRLALTDTTRQLTEANAEVERLTLELRDATINADESDEIAAELFSLCCAVVDEKPDAAAARDSLQKHIEHVRSCRRGSCATELGETQTARAGRLEAALRDIAENPCCDSGMMLCCDRYVEVACRALADEEGK